MKLKSFNKSIFGIFIVIFLALTVSAKADSSDEAITISGRILTDSLQGVPNGVPVFIGSVETDWKFLITFVNDFSGKKPSGSYSARIDGFDENQIEIAAWNSTHIGDRLITLNGESVNADIVLNEPKGVEADMIIKTIPLVGKITENTIDTDGDGLYNYLTLNMDVYVPISGNYSISAILTDDSGEHEVIQKLIPEEFELKAGKNRLQINFSGIDIYNSGIDGSFNIEEFEITELGFKTDVEELFFNKEYVHSTKAGPLIL